MRAETTTGSARPGHDAATCASTLCRDLDRLDLAHARGRPIAPRSAPARSGAQRGRGVRRRQVTRARRDHEQPLPARWPQRQQPGVVAHEGDGAAAARRASACARRSRRPPSVAPGTLPASAAAAATRPQRRAGRRPAATRAARPGGCRAIRSWRPGRAGRAARPRPPARATVSMTWPAPWAIAFMSRASVMHDAPEAQVAPQQVAQDRRGERARGRKRRVAGRPPGTPRGRS